MTKTENVTIIIDNECFPPLNFGLEQTGFLHRSPFFLSVCDYKQAVIYISNIYYSIDKINEMRYTIYSSRKVEHSIKAREKRGNNYV